MFGGLGKAAGFGMFGVVIYKKFCFVVLMRVFLEKEEEKKALAAARAFERLM